MKNALFLALPFVLTAPLCADYITDVFDYVRTTVTFETVAALNPDNPADVPIGNIGPVAFATKVASAYAGNYGGVINFEAARVLNTGVNTDIENITWTGSAFVARTNLRAQTLTANLGASGPAVTVSRGANWYIEASGIANLGTAAGPGIPSPGDNNINGEWFFEFARNPSENRTPTSGTDVLGGATSWDFAFDLADNVVAVGMTYLGRDNFQWYAPQGTPTLYAKVTYSDNSTAQWETGLEQRSDSSWDVFVGVEAPAGLTIAGLHLWHRGVNNRAFSNIDDIAIIVVPEPRVYALLAGLAALGLVWLRRRRC